MGPTREEYDSFRQTWGTGETGTSWDANGLNIRDYGTGNPRPNLTVFVQNNSGADAPAGTVLWLRGCSGRAFSSINPDASITEVDIPNSFNPLMDGYAGRGSPGFVMPNLNPAVRQVSPAAFCITVEPITSGAVGLAAIAGVCPGFFPAATNNIRYAVPKDDRNLEASRRTDSPLEIIQGTTGSNQYGLVRFRNVPHAVRDGVYMAHSPSKPAIAFPHQFLFTLGPANHEWILHHHGFGQFTIASGVTFMQAWLSFRSVGSTATPSAIPNSDVIICGGMLSNMGTNYRQVRWNAPFPSLGVEIFASCGFTGSNPNTAGWSPGCTAEPAVHPLAFTGPSVTYTSPPSPPIPAPPAPPPPPPGTPEGTEKGWYNVTKDASTQSLYFEDYPVDPSISAVLGGPFETYDDAVADLV